MAGRRTGRHRDVPSRRVRCEAAAREARSNGGPARRRSGFGRAASSLANIRERIDAVDGQLHALINERARLAQQVGISKHAAGHTVDFYRPEREAQVLRLALERNQRDRGPLRDEEILRLFREIMSACLAQQEPLKIGYLGPEGTFTQQAVLKHFGHSVRALPLTSIEEVFHEVEAGDADFGVVPIENSSEGTVNNTLDMFLTSPLTDLRRGRAADSSQPDGQHDVARATSCASARIRRRSRSAGAGCRRTCRRSSGCRSAATPKARVVRATKTAPLRSPRPAAAEVYGLNMLMPEIEDRPDNTTRFLVVGRKAFPASGIDKTTLLLSIAHTDAPGALFRLLEPFARHAISMNRIESRPSRRRKWDYVFFIDLDGHGDVEPLATALGEVKERASLYRVLGSYPRAIL